MKFLIIFATSILLILLIWVDISAPEIAEDEGVLVVTKSNFEEAISVHSNILVEFYAPWCGHCKSLAPEYVKAAEQLYTMESDIKLAKVDATQETELAKRFDITGYPTLKFFKNGMPQDYKGPRKAEGIVDWLVKKTGPVVSTIESEEAFTKFKNKNAYCVIGFFDNLETPEAKIFSTAAEVIEGSPIGIIVNTELMTELAITPNSIIAYRQYDAPSTTYEEEFSEENILQFIKLQKFHLVTEFSPKESENLFDGTINTHFLFFAPTGVEETTQVLSDLQGLAEGYRGQILFIHVDTNNSEYNSILEFFGISQFDLPCVRIVSLSKENVERYKQTKTDLSQEAISNFLTDFFDGKLSQDFKSEDVPENWDDGAVKILTSMNFDEVVNAKDKRAIVEFYAPWCGHCKALSPIWDKLGEHFEDDEDVVVAKIDSTKNEIVDIPITGFPTIKYFPANSDDIIDYGGDRELDDFIKFVESDGKIGAKTPGDDEDSTQEVDEGGDESLEDNLDEDNLPRVDDRDEL